MKEPQIWVGERTELDALGTCFSCKRIMPKAELTDQFCPTCYKLYHGCRRLAADIKSETTTGVSPEGGGHEGEVGCGGTNLARIVQNRLCTRSDVNTESGGGSMPPPRSPSLEPGVQESFGTRNKPLLVASGALICFFPLRERRRATVRRRILLYHRLTRKEDCEL